MQLFLLLLIFCKYINSSAQKIDSAWIQNSYVKRFTTDTGIYLSDIKLIDEKSTLKKLSHYKGKFVMLNIWTTWCAPCKVNFKHLPQLKERLKIVHLDSVIQFINICTEDSKKEWRQLLIKINPPGVNLFSVDTSLYEKWNITSFPTTILLDTSGKIIAKHFTDAREPVLTDFLLYAGSKGIHPVESIWIYFRQAKHYEKFQRYTDDEEGKNYSVWMNSLLSFFIQHHQTNTKR